MFFLARDPDSFDDVKNEFVKNTRATTKKALQNEEILNEVENATFDQFHMSRSSSRGKLRLNSTDLDWDSVSSRFVETL